MSVTTGPFPFSLVRHICDAVDDGIDLGLNDLSLSGPRATMPAALDVTGLAVGAVAAASLTAAQLLAARQRTAPAQVRIDTREVAAAFASESLFTPIGWERPTMWDPIAGNYRTTDGWIRLHTNYSRHRMAVETLLDARDHASVQERVSRWRADELEQAVVAAGGAAAAMRTHEQWLATPAGAAAAGAPTVSILRNAADERPEWGGEPKRPFDGLKVLDLTRVIAGPVCTKFLAGYGADVLRLDPPGFEEVPALLPVTTAGKRTAALDLHSIEGRRRFDALLSHADVLVCGLRADALDRLGYSNAHLRALNPGLVIARLNAYGWTGPWRNRRGFDSLVQLSSGIATTGAPEGSAPTSLPVQALDHATGWLLGAAISRALLRRLTDHETTTIHTSLIGTANLLFELPTPEESSASTSADDVPLIEQSTAWGPARIVGPAGRIQGVPQVLKHIAGPLGRHEANWE